MATRNPRRRKVVDPGTPLRATPDSEQVIDDMLKKVQDELMPDRARDVVAINTDEALIGTGLLTDCDLAIDFVAASVKLSRKPPKRRK